MSYPPIDNDIPTNFGNTTLNFNTHPEAHNSTNQAIRDIRDELGTNPKGSKSTVQERLQDLESQINLAVFSGGGGGGTPSGVAGGDLTGNYPSPTIGAGVISGYHINNNLRDQGAAIASLRTLGIGANQALPGNHSTTSDPRIPKGSAGPVGGVGDLTGSYPNPTIGAGKVTTAHLADGAVTDAKLATTAWFAGDLKWSARTSEQMGSGWLLCDGRAVSRTTYQALFDIIGTKYGTGNGSTTFNLPDARARTLIGAGTGQNVGSSGSQGTSPATGGIASTARALGDWGGVESVALTLAQMPQHNHTATSTNAVTDAGHAHFTSASVGARNGNQELVPINYTQSPSIFDSTGGTTSVSRLTTSSSTASVTVTTATTIGNAGSGSAHENMIPFTVGNLFIKT